MRTPEQIAQQLMDSVNLKDYQSSIGGEVRELLIQAAREAQREAQREPLFKPDDQPDKYRGQWQKIVYPEDSPKWFCGVQLLGPQGKTQYLEITQDQARRILAMLSEESEA